MINLFHINNHTIDTAKYSSMLHDGLVTTFEDTIAEYVGAKYAVSFNSATSAIFLALQNKDAIIDIPSMIPPVVLNAIITSGNRYRFKDDIEWVGDSYILHDFGDYKIVDSAQKLEKDQFKKECNDNDLMVFSFYPTKPVGSCDGGMIVSNDWEKIKHFKEMALNGMSYSHNNWERVINFPGYKMYMNSIQAEIALKNFTLYEDKLRSLDVVRKIYNENFNLTNSSNHLYRIEVGDRDSFIKFMKECGIGCGIHYKSTHLLSVYKSQTVDNTIKCPLSEEKSKKTVSIPFNERLTIEDIDYIINKVNKFKNR